jgi:hypothetical protein
MPEPLATRTTYTSNYTQHAPSLTHCCSAVPNSSSCLYSVQSVPNTACIVTVRSEHSVYCGQDWRQVTWVRGLDWILREFRVFLFLVCTAVLHVSVCLSVCLFAVSFLLMRTRKITTIDTFIVFICRYTPQPLEVCSSAGTHSSHWK